MHRRTASALLAVAGLLALGPVRADAGRLAVSSTVATRYRPGAVEVRLRLVNRGDEPVEEVTASAHLAGRSAQADAVPELLPGACTTVRLDLATAPLPPGAFVLPVRVRYTDRLGRPFGHVTAARLDTVVPEPGAVPSPAAALRVTPAAGTPSALVLELRNPADSAQELRCTPVVPDALPLADPQAVRRVTLAPHGQAVVRWALAPPAAAPGSLHRVLAIVERDAPGAPWAQTARARVRLPPATRLPPGWRPAAAVAAALLLLAGLAGRSGAAAPRARHQLDILFLAVATAVPLTILPWASLLSDTMTIGGDTPAHNVIAAALQRHLFARGRLIDWCGDWWTGFPLFQFYFVLPYLLMVLLNLVLPFNIAFKLVSILGIAALPAAAWRGARLAGLRRPLPGLLALATVPLLFDPAHAMWGVNIKSTLAGMLSNSLSFPVFCLALGAGLRDARRGRAHLETTLWLTLLPASHFFTTVMAVLCLAAVPLLFKGRARARAAGALLQAGLPAGLLMAWWLVPLVARRAYAVDFGVNWPVDLLRTLPRAGWGALPLALAALWPRARGTAPPARRRFVLLHAWMLAAAAALFAWGYALSPVFVNVRLWPFLLHALLALAALGAGRLLTRAPRPRTAGLVLLLAVTALGVPWNGDERAWARFNYAGLEALPRYPVFRTLTEPLRGTPGRLAWDLHPANEALGSSRIFECVPARTGKATLEGGLVNSAWGSLFAYTVQGETSRNAAGFPTRVTPPPFAFARASRHLALFNVKHFIARDPRTRAAFDASPDWTPLATAGPWALYEARHHDGRYVYVPPGPVHAAGNTDRQQAGLDWLAADAALYEPVILLGAGEHAPAGIDTWGPDAYAAFLAARSGPFPAPAPDRDLTAPVHREQVDDHRIRFTTDAVGRPHIIKCQYYPRWQAVRGARHVYMVTPGFMLVIPEARDVELVFGYTPVDRLGHALTLAGACLVGFRLLHRGARRRQA